jgi:hypothetical protein
VKLLVCSSKLSTTIESTALSHGDLPKQEVAVADLVYFQQHLDPTRDWIRIGFTGGNGRREDRQEEFEPIAVIQGCDDDEANLHQFFDRHRVARKIDRSTYQGDEVYDYVTWLLERNFAGRNRQEAEQLPRLPWSVWRPQERRNEDRGGQLSLLADLPKRERISVARSDLAHLSSESDDWYTPANLIDAARKTMGSIDTDPASCITAQRQIGATIFYTKDQDGLRTDLPWKGAVWLNPPYGRGESSATAFVTRLLKEFKAGTITQAITCLNLASSCALWFDPIWETATVHLIYRGRPNFWNGQHQDSSPTKGIILSYFGDHSDRFIAAFERFGHIIEARKERGEWRASAASSRASGATSVSSA